MCHMSIGMHLKAAQKMCYLDIRVTQGNRSISFQCVRRFGRLSR